MKRTLRQLVDLFLRPHVNSPTLKPAVIKNRYTPAKTGMINLKWLGVSIFVLLGCYNSSALHAQTTYDFSTAASISAVPANFGWNNTAKIMIDGVEYTITVGGNGSLTNSANGGNGNTKALKKESAGGDQFLLERTDKQPFQFYGIWIKHQSMNSYSEFYTLPPWYTITYTKTVGAPETEKDMNPMVGNTNPGTYTTSVNTHTKNLTVTSVSIYFQALVYLWIDDIKVGPAVATVPPAITTQPANRSICAGNNTSFSVAASNATGYQWQVNTGSGFTNLSNGAPYSGATTATLSISNATSLMSGYQYRCVANETGTATSNSGTLTVGNLSAGSGAQTNLSCNGGSNGSATVVPSGGTAPYTYSWSPSGGTNSTASGLMAGAYTVTVTDAAGCQATRSYTITQPAGMSVSGSQTNLSCNGGSNGSASVTVSGGAGSYTYSWSPSGGTAATATGLVAGTYTVTITDANACQKTQSFTITQPTALSATSTQTNVSCNSGSNGTATVNPTGGTPGYTYSWSPSGGTGKTATGLSAGNYSVTVTDANGCTYTHNLTVTQPAAFIATGSQTNTSCFGGSNGTATVVPVGGTAPYSYSWSPSGGISATASGLPAGNYTVTVTDANGCTTSKNYTITQPPAFSASSSQTNVSCNGAGNGSASVTPTGGTAPYTYSWSPSGGTASTATGLLAGTYTANITDANGCFITRSFTITQPSAISASSSQTNIACNGGSNGSLSVTPTGGTAPYTYSWAPSGGTAATATGLIAGTYSVTITDANGCTTTKTFTLTQPAAITASKSQTNVSCNGGSNGTASVLVNGGTGTYTYAWSPYGGTSKTATGMPAGNYTVAITDDNGCVKTENFTITEPAAMVSTPSQTNVTCNGAANGSATVAVSGGSAPYTYSWSPSGGTASTASGLWAGTYTAFITDINGCVATNTFTITQPMVVTGSASNSTITVCSGTTTNIPLNSNTSGATFTWTVSDLSGSVTGATAGSGTTIAQALSGNGVIKYTVTPANGSCTGTPFTVIVIVDALTTVNNHPANSSIYDEENTSFEITADYATGFQWQVNKGSGFENITNGGVYSHATTAKLDIHNATGDMNGYVYRCSVTGKCGAVVSNDAVLTVKVRTVQTISFPSTASATYGDDDFTPDASSNGGTKLQYTSSDESVATIVDGKIRIHKAGKTTITASHPGNDDFKPAYPVEQELTIDQKTLIVTLSETPLIAKTYDGSTSATLVPGNYVINGIAGEDEVSVTGVAHYEDHNAGSQKRITVSDIVMNGAAISNYKLKTNTAEITGNITRKDITVEVNATPLVSKTYDANTTATLAAANFSLVGLIGDDEAGITAEAHYENRNAGHHKAIEVTGFVLNGKDKDNYNLTTSVASTSGDINARPITMTLSATPVITKIYDGETKANLDQANYVLQDVMKGDDVSVSGAAFYEDKNAASDIPVTVSKLLLSGTDKDNYLLTTTTEHTSGSITQKTIVTSLQAIPDITKSYDGTADAHLSDANYLITGIIDGDDVALNNPASGTYDNKNGGTGKLVTVSGLEMFGEHAFNYKLESESISAPIGIITPKEIQVVALAKTKQYGSNDPELTYVAEGKLEEDVLTGTLVREAGKNTGVYAITIGSVVGGENYKIVEFTPASLTITPAPLVITAEDKTKTQGEANPVFTFKYEGLTGGDNPADLSRAAIATTTAIKESQIGYYDINASGAMSENYTITLNKGKLTILPAGGKNHSLKAWSSGPGMLQIRIYTDVAQKAAIILYTETGQQIIWQQHQLQKGINSFSMPVGHLSSSTYILGVAAEKFKESQKLSVK